jgi:hypothetical protein
MSKWKGWTVYNDRVFLRKPGHPKANRRGYIRRSHAVWEAHNGPLQEGFIVHHRNGNSQDDRIENLEMLRIGEHIRLHNLGKRGERRSMRKGFYKGVCGNPHCKREFTMKTPWQKYCSDRCRLIAWAGVIR